MNQSLADQLAATIRGAPAELGPPELQAIRDLAESAAAQGQ